MRGHTNVKFTSQPNSKICEQQILSLSRLSVRMEQLGSHWRDFPEIIDFSIFRKSVEKIQISLTSDKNNGELYMKTYAHLWQYFAEFFLLREMFHIKFVEKIHTFYVQLSFSKSCRLWDNVEKYCRVGQATDDNITRLMRTACWITKATDTHSAYVILIAFARQQWLCERAWMVSFM